MVLVKIFKESVLLGIVGIIIWPFAFVYGWMKNVQYGIKKLMLIWTVSGLLSFFLFVLAFVFAARAAATT